MQKCVATFFSYSPLCFPPFFKINLKKKKLAASNVPVLAAIMNDEKIIGPDSFRPHVRFSDERNSTATSLMKTVGFPVRGPLLI